MKKSFVLCFFITVLVVLCGCSTSNTSNLNEVYLPCKITKTGNWGFVTPKGEILCENTFKNEPTAAIDGVFFVQEGSAYSMYRIEQNSPKLLLGDLSAYGTVVNGLVPVCIKGKGLHVVDTNGQIKFAINEIDGNEVTECRPYFEDGYLLVITKNKSGNKNLALVNENGVAFSMLQEYNLSYLVCSYVCKDIIHVVDLTNSRSIYLDREGKRLEWLDAFDKVYAYTWGIKDYVICERYGKIFIYSYEGEQVLQCPQEVYSIELEGIKNDFIIYENKDEKEGVIDIKGNEILPAIYNDVIFMNHGFFAQKDYKEWILFDEAGKEQRRFNNYFEIKEVDGFGHVASSNIYKNEDGVEYENYWEDYWVVLNNCDPINNNKFYYISCIGQGWLPIENTIPTTTTHTDWEEMGLKGKVKELQIVKYEAEKISDGNYAKGKIVSQEFFSFSEEGLKKISAYKNQYNSSRTDYSYLNDTIYTNTFSENYWNNTSSSGQHKEVKMYDEAGNLILHCDYDDNKVSKGRAWRYGRDGLLQEYYWFGDNEEILAHEVWEYNYNNQVVMHTREGKPEEYNEYGEPIDLARCEKNYEYDENGKILKYDVYTLDGEFLRTVHYDSDGHKIDVDGNVTRIYDEKGRLISIISRGDDNEIFFKESNTYNEDGKLILKIQDNLENDYYKGRYWSKEIWKYLYEYDDQGNVISKIYDNVMMIHEKEGEHRCSITEYSIVYYE